MPNAKQPRLAPTAEFTAGGQTLTLEQWAQRLGYTMPSFYNRIAKIGVEAAITRAKPSLAARARKGATTWRKVESASAKSGLSNRQP